MKFFLYISFIVLIGFGGCTFSPNKFAVITIKGSDTMLQLMEVLAQEYMKANPGISIYVYGGGTAGGIKAISRGEADIAMTSRKLTNDEIKKISDRFSSLAVSYMVAKDALSIYVNPNNKVKNFTLEQLKGIFSGKITNWKALGGDDAEIIPVTRTPNSGTYIYFKEHILVNSDFTPQVLIKSSYEELLKEISSNKYAVSFGGFVTAPGIIHANVEGIEPTEESIINDRYPINRYLYFYTINNARGHIKDFIDWVLSPDGQKIVKRTGYFPLWTVSF